MDRRTFIATAGSGVAFALAGCLDAQGAPGGDNEVGMSIDSFQPEELTVEAGTTVEFVNTSSHTHTVTAFQDGYPDGTEFWSTGEFGSEDEAVAGWNDDRSGGLFQGESYEHTFEVPGEYAYFCIPHLDADMVGEIRVEPL